MSAMVISRQNGSFASCAGKEGPVIIGDVGYPRFLALLSRGVQFIPKDEAPRIAATTF